MSDKARTILLAERVGIGTSRLIDSIDGVKERVKFNNKYCYGKNTIKGDIILNFIDIEVNNSRDIENAVIALFFKKADLIVVTVDIYSIVEDLYFLLRVMEATSSIIANCRGIVNVDEISDAFGICAVDGKDIGLLQKEIIESVYVEDKRTLIPTKYLKEADEAVKILGSKIKHLVQSDICLNYISLSIITEEKYVYTKIADELMLDNYEIMEMYYYGKMAREILYGKSLPKGFLRMEKERALMNRAKETAKNAMGNNEFFYAKERSIAEASRFHNTFFFIILTTMIIWFVFLLSKLMIILY